jgi:hypothetical protein
MTWRVFLAVACAAVMLPQAVIAQWKQVTFRDAATLSHCPGPLPSFLDEALRNLQRRTGNTQPEPYKGDIGSWQRSVDPCKFEDILATTTSEDLKERELAQKSIISGLNSALVDLSNGREDYGPLIEKWIHKIDIRGAAILYARAGCIKKSPCLRSFRDIQPYLSVEEEEVAQLNADDLPPFVYAYVAHDADEQSELTYLRELFGAYRADPLADDDLQWALSPLFGYPADFVPFAWVDCGRVGHEARYLRVNSDPFGVYDQMDRTQVTVVFLARRAGLNAKLNDRIQKGESSRQLAYWHSSSCKVFPKDEELPKLFATVWSEMARD